jgi:hypothetical protein
MTGEWIDAAECKPIIYIDVLVLDSHGNKRKGQWMGHDCWSVEGYPVLGQAKVTHWKQ